MQLERKKAFETVYAIASTEAELPIDCLLEYHRLSNSIESATRKKVADLREAKERRSPRIL